MSAAIFFIVNPAAQNGKATVIWAAIQEYMDTRGLTYEYALSADLEDVASLARTAAAKPGTIVVGVGGDGTLSCIAGALVETEAVLGIIPAGTGNDFARTMGIPLSPTAACDVLFKGATVPLDLGLYNGKYFYNTIGAGLDAEVAADANKFKRFSSIAYLLALLKQLAVYRPHPVSIEVDGNIVTGPVWLVTVANAKYYGGGMKIAPFADPQDGLADIIIVGNVHRLNFLRLFPLVYSGRHINHPAVQVLHGKEIRIYSTHKLAVHADGDLAGTTPVSVKMCHHAIQLRVPE